MNETLKIYECKEEIVEAVKTCDTVLIDAQPGTGKTTQVPQYLYDAGWRVIVIEPRMLEAYSGYKRILKERGLEEGSYEVGCKTKTTYRNVTNSGILFCVSGLSIIVRMPEEELARTVIVIDEVHEWKIPQEILMGWINTYRAQGHKLKIVLMSATMDIESLTRFYIKHSSVKTITIKEKQYPVTCKSVNSKNAMYSKACEKAYREGKSSLVFCIGITEIEEVIHDLKRRLADLKYIEGESQYEVEVLPMHGGLSFDEQQRIFEDTGKPKIIVCTNIAQSGVTPPIQCVFDNGVEKRVEVEHGVECLETHLISEADCKQREGRAGRVGPGEYYRLTHYKDDQRLEYPVPEIQRLLLDKTVMKLLSFGIDPLEIQFFHQPSKESIQYSLNMLEELGAMKDGELTEDGKKMCEMPVGIRSARMLLEAAKLGCMDEIIKAVSIIETGSLLNNKYCDDHFIDYSYFSERGKRSDILAEIDIYNQIRAHKFDNMKEHGILKKTFIIVKNAVSNLRNTLKRQGYDVYQRAKSEDDIIQCIFKGMETSIMEHYGSNEAIDVNSVKWMFSYVSGVSPVYDEFLIGTPRSIEGYRKYIHILQFATVITSDEIIKYGNPDKFEAERTYEALDSDNIIHYSVRQLYRNHFIGMYDEQVSPQDPNYEEIYKEFKELIEMELAYTARFNELRGISNA